MKISIEEIDIQKEEEIIIRCHEVTDEIMSLISRIKVKNKMLMGFQEDTIHQIKLSDVYYFESVDNKVFMYCKDKVFEAKQKLYELEQVVEGKKFFRASKSSILNIAKIAYIKPSISGRFEARMDNGETVMVSRQYVPILKSMLGL
ncbi:MULTISPECIES: LytTR family DNA-binding domain-containing protein [Paenibacillus]|uniref:LytTR family transcriptional regulator DNA-binding domain-containing protein n=1 Tax=Paenibacillus alvei TaxID=44250 RepID=A0ABT4ED48_PAEAL|nr:MULTISPECIES: LytTR family DNA-binding domain-containing protein [Paenibacillus]EPY14516.1 response regulator receiver protein [Paenibacillus alvei A6-6i-x]MCY9531535.1 LytTR family transcriptional regulator DNA-binding domain-containing protein [Paenibacillus alvei]SDG14703.1 LytTr DNA-binding domain-containing protein [Paenibacillus sp. cl6col]